MQWMYLCVLAESRHQVKPNGFKSFHRFVVSHAAAMPVVGMHHELNNDALL
jgi:hypothetical protein